MTHRNETARTLKRTSTTITTVTGFAQLQAVSKATPEGGKHKWKRWRGDELHFAHHKPHLPRPLSLHLP